MSQLVGQPCVRCGQPLVSLLAGGVCPGCGKAVHHGCLAPDAGPDTPWHCSSCGGDPSSVPEQLAEDRLTLAPSFESTPERPFQVPDLRKRVPLRKKVLLALVLLVLGGTVLGLCFFGYRWSQRRNIERMVRKGFEDNTRQIVDAIHLERQDDGNYAGTITTTAGEDWEVTARTTPPSQSWQMVWRLPLERAENVLRQDMEKQFNKKVVSIKLTRQSDGQIGGTAELQSGEVYDIREDDRSHSLVYEYNPPTMEKCVREYARQQHNDVLDKLTLTRQAPLNYSGTASGASGLDYRVLITAPPGTSRPQLTMPPLPESLPRWVTRGVEQQMKVKVTKITLTPHPEGYSSGQLVTDTGLVYDVRAGIPPAWRKDHRSDRPHWQVVLSPSSYETWVKMGLEKDRGSAVRSLRLRRRPSGSQVGVARLADGTTLWVVLEKKKRKREEGEKNLWPDLPDETVTYRTTTEMPRE
jgi:hypothetical protein